jgi:hypothetical protein
MSLFDTKKFKVNVDSFLFWYNLKPLEIEHKLQKPQSCHSHSLAQKRPWNVTFFDTNKMQASVGAFLCFV